MKLRMPVVYTLTSLAAILFARSAISAEEKAVSTKDQPAQTQGAGPDMEEMMKRWEAYATPGANHKMLEPLVGEWTVEARFWMGGQGNPPMESKGTSKVQWILGGRYLQEEFSGEMMQRPFQGIGITAYDNFRKKYLSTWIDSTGTGIFTSEGTADETGKVLTFLGKMDEPTTGQKDKPTKHIVHIISPDKHTFEMHDLSLGDKSKVFEMVYTRKS
jgi:hypothetical protein